MIFAGGIPLKRSGKRYDSRAEATVVEQGRQLLDQLRRAAAAGQLDDITTPEWAPVRDLLEDFRLQKVHLAIVLDEYGGVAGILTVKDLLEPLVGDLHDEFDEVEEPMIVRVDGTRWLIDGQTNVDVVRERLGMDLPDGEYVTLGGLLFERFGHIPAEGEQVQVGDWDLRVVEMDKRRVAQVVATSLSSTPAGPAAEEPLRSEG